jgi:hypothetical protein
MATAAWLAVPMAILGNAHSDGGVTGDGLGDDAAG